MEAITRKHKTVKYVLQVLPNKCNKTTKLSTKKPVYVKAKKTCYGSIQIITKEELQIPYNYIN